MGRRRSPPPPRHPKKKRTPPPAQAAGKAPPPVPPAGEKPPPPRGRRSAAEIVRFLSIVLGIFAVYGLCLAAPWAASVWWGFGVAIPAAILITIPWLFMVRYEPLGIKMGPFAVGALINVGGVLASWLIVSI